MLVQLDAAGWSTPLDFLNALRAAIGAPDWQGNSPDAFVDTIFWDGCNRLQPPYHIQVACPENAPIEVVNYIDLMTLVLSEARADRYTRIGSDIDVSLARGSKG